LATRALAVPFIAMPGSLVSSPLSLFRHRAITHHSRQIFVELDDQIEASR
jgi:hypothetical protein